MKISYDDGTFNISCGFDENHLVRGLPNVRFVRRERMWRARRLRANCQHIKDRLWDYCTDKAKKIVDETLEERRVLYKPFPAYYPFKTKPFKHQREALDFIYGLDRWALFMEMGTGKTKTSIDCMSAHLSEGRISRLMIFAPVNIRRNWQREIAIHSPLNIPVYVLESGKKAQAIVDEAISQPMSILIIGIESLQVLSKGTVYEAAISYTIDAKYGVIVDESHLVKGHDSNRAKNVQALSERSEVMGIMTGTPTSQGFIDLYMQFEVLDPNILGVGSFYSFRNRYCVMGGFEDREIVGYDNVEELISLTKPQVYQITKAEALDLPEKTYQMITVQMTKEQAQAYKQMDEDMEVRMATDDGLIDMAVEQAITKYGILQQIAGGFMYVDRDDRRIPKLLVSPDKNPKAKEVLRIAQEHPERSIVIWCKYRTEIDIVTGLLEAHFPGQVVGLHGGIDRDERPELLDRFDRREARFLVSNAGTGGVGLNMTVSDLVIYYSNSFRLVDRTQSEDRTHRIGQDKNVLYVDLMAEGTKDFDIRDSLEYKQDLAVFLRDKLKRGLTA